VTGRTVARLGLGASLLLAAAVRAPHLDFVPIWDGRQYWDHCVAPALQGPFDPMAFNCFGHRSMLYMLAVSWPQYLSHGSALLLNLAHAGMSLLTIVAFHRIATLLFPPREERESGLDAALLTLVFTAMPAWTASAINLNPDAGVLTGFTVALWMFLAGRRHLAVAAGLFLVLSKEMGLLLWLVSAGVETLLAVRRENAGARLRAIARRWTYLLPPLAYVLVGMVLRAQNRYANWGTQIVDNRSLLETFLTIDFTAPHYVAYVADLFVLNFSWVMTIFIVVWLSLVLRAILTKRTVPLAAQLERHRGAMLALVTPAVFYLVTRFPTFNNVRYLLPAFPLVVLAFGIALASLVPTIRVRVAMLATAAALQLASMAFTIDPVSKFVFGTFPFGRHEMLVMTSLRNECCGYGRDQLVYNLQYTRFDSLQQTIFSTLRPRDGEVFAIAGLANWTLHGPLDAKTYRPTLRTQNVIRPRVLTVHDFAKGEPLPNRMRYIAWPNVDNRPDLRLLSRAYHIRRPTIIDENGYEVAVFDLERRVVVIPANAPKPE
jgi:hypothetical protein